ncbi:hypothetical protein HELRODRAFT_164249 [Helobdella robusta]|uniref:Uncharacterized protein n=1 Tax=Helobdella robusta TaxID=6412 RepID=T1EV58_HELRO|nr:hypothetical protein HELRODRAFT_164249 [Helobdella robusta]ESN94412.1 hypothetical protein HELRODRAFT_164249 [Helobdella robusta]
MYLFNFQNCNNIDAIKWRSPNIAVGAKTTYRCQTRRKVPEGFENPNFDDKEANNWRLPNIAVGAKTTDYYQTRGKIPERFDNPDCFKGYGKVEANPRYRTSNSSYGSISPNVHTMPTSFFLKSQEFTKIMLAGDFNIHVEKTVIHTLLLGYIIIFSGIGLQNLSKGKLLR